MVNTAIIVPARLCSERVPKKPLVRLRNGQRLIDRALHQLNILKVTTKTSVFLSCWEGDVELVDAARLHCVDILPLTEEGSRGDWVEMSSCWKDLPFDWLMPINTICHPFVSLQTLEYMLNSIERVKYPFIACKIERSLAWNGELKPILAEDGILDTKTSPLLATPAHIGDAYQPSDCGVIGGRVSKPYPLVIPLQAIELLDLDTPDELELLQRIHLD